MIAILLLAVTLPTNGSPSPASPPAAVTAAAPSAAVQPSPAVVVNGVLFRGVEFDTEKSVWRNLAVTVTADHIEAWRALSVGMKNRYAALLIDNYRTGMSYDRDIKLTFVDEQNATLDQYLWTAPPSERK